MDILFRGLCELQIDNIQDESMIQEYSGLLTELGIPEELMSCFLMGYIAGSARSQLNASSLAISNRPLNKGEFEVFSEVLGRRMNEILGKMLEHGIENLVEEGGGIEEPRPEVSGENEEEAPDKEESEKVPLRAVATIGEPEVGTEKFSFKKSGRKKAAPTILGIPVHT
jgi:hypothetical protein